MWGAKPKSDDPGRKPQPTASDKGARTDKQKGDAHRARANKRSRDMSQGAREIGEIPPVKDQARRDLCKFNLKLFCETYLKGVFPDPWAEFHLTTLETLQEIILTGGMFVNAIPRGSGKSALCAGAAIWCGAYGHRPYAVIVCATDTKAGLFLKNIKRTIETSHLLAEDFPEICTPINALEHLAQRANGQTYQGQPTFVEWSADALVFPSIPGSAASGFRIATAGITGDIRGLVFCNSDGVWVRPSFVICDDCQTDESAKSITQTKDRIDITNGAILGLASKESMAVAMCVTVIRPGDYADHFLKSDDWNGQRAGILDKLPAGSTMAKWMEYRDIQRLKIPPKEKAKRLADFYIENKTELEGDIKATWPARFDPKTEVTAIQAAMNRYFLGGSKKFAAEYMNNPQDMAQTTVPKLDAQDVRERLNGLRHRQVPLGYDIVVAFVDIQKPCMWPMIMAFRQDGFDGVVIDYSVTPEQERRYVENLNELVVTLQSESQADEADLTAALLWGLDNIGKEFLDREWIREDGVPLKIKRCHIDINYPDSQEAVAKFCRTSKWKSILFPSRGMGSHTTRRPISEWIPKEGEWHPPKSKRRDLQCMVSAPGKHLLREVYFQTDHWKTRVNTALAITKHASGSISLYGDNPAEHEMLADHLTSHYSEQKPMHGVSVTIWHLKIGVERDDLLDGVVGCCVAAAIEGCELKHRAITEAEKPTPKPRKTRVAQEF